MFSVWQELLCLLRYICLVVEGCLYSLVLLLQCQQCIGLSSSVCVLCSFSLSYSCSAFFSLWFLVLYLSLSSVPAFAFLFDQRERERRKLLLQWATKEGGRERGRLYLAFEYFLRAFRFKSPSLFLYISNCATGYVGGNLERVFVQL